MRRSAAFVTALIGKNSLLKEGIARILESTNFRILDSVLCADELASKTRSQQLLLLVHSGDDFRAAIEEINLLRDRHLCARIAIVADRYRPGDLMSAFRAGAHGCFVEIMTTEIFVRSLELLTMGQTIFPSALLSFFLDAESACVRDVIEQDKKQSIFVAAETMAIPHLSAREEAILCLLIEGDSNKCIARKAGIAEATVKVHVKTILRKIRVQNRTQAAVWGLQNTPSTRLWNGCPATFDFGSVAEARESTVRCSGLPQVSEATPLVPMKAARITWSK